LTINLEKIKILELVLKTSYVNPNCPECTRRLKSMGKNQGFRCDKCGFRSSELKKLQVNEERGFKGELIITSPRSQRHLTKPHRRYGREKNEVPKLMIENWHYP
jgi:tRNA(Ile2)-agmatinylcytidine synthase